ncbi:hypothetical protein GCM10007096_14440 [Pullulanibacillus pueri]|uniref:Uncharacterized protein n=1 Tax=Pullulanibacillus pueri TaxID=1437324 RepID=A0A8J3EL35_9BACL|nr:hypothetical protein GCM10007096_14440 [Pullulanibacillus pueri]
MSICVVDENWVQYKMNLFVKTGIKRKNSFNMIAVHHVYLISPFKRQELIRPLRFTKDNKQQKKESKALDGAPLG